MKLSRVDGWDWLVRSAHWSVAILFALNYFEFISPDEYAHVQIGYAIAIIVGVRILWGFILAKGPNRILSFIPTPSAMKRHIDELKSRQSPEQPHHNPFGALAIWTMWFGLLAVVLTGWMFDNTDYGWDNDFDKLHVLLGDLLFYVVVLHISAVVLTSLWLRRNLIKAVIIGRF